MLDRRYFITSHEISPAIDGSRQNLYSRIVPKEYPIPGTGTTCGEVASLWQVNLESGEARLKSSVNSRRIHGAHPEKAGL